MLSFMSSEIIKDSSCVLRVVIVIADICVIERDAFLAFVISIHANLSIGHLRRHFHNDAKTRVVLLDIKNACL